MAIETNNIDPRVKFFFLICVSTISIIIKNLLFMFLVLLFTIFLFIIIRKKTLKTISYFRKVLWLSLPIMAFQIIFYYNPLFPIYIVPKELPVFGGWILLSFDGIFYGLLISFRIMILILSGSIFAMTTSRKDFLISLSKMKVPFIISFMVSLALFFLPLILMESEEVQMAMEAKGISVSHGGIGGRLSNLKIILTTVFLNFILNTNNMAMALQTRGFRIKGERTFYRDISISKLDVFLLIIIPICSIFIIFITYYPFYREFNFWTGCESIFDYILFKLNGSRPEILPFLNI